MIKKRLLIFISNIIICLLIIIGCEIAIFKYYDAESYKKHPAIYQPHKFNYENHTPTYMTDLEGYYDGKNNIYTGRTPDGLEYKNKTPIVVFGCSVAFGQYLNYNQTFSYKLAHILKRPVYNRAMPGSSIQHMYMQSKSDSLYKTIPNTDTVFYVLISDHYRRSMVTYFDILNNFIYTHYSIKNNKLVEDNYNNPIKLFFRSLYISKFINHLYANYFIHNEKNSDKLTNNILLYFTETRKEFQKHWGNNFKFIIIMYEDWDIIYKDELKDKLEKAGFTVILTQELTNENLKDEKWQMQDNFHPTEAAWDMLTPKIIERLNLN